MELTSAAIRAMERTPVLNAKATEEAITEFLGWNPSDAKQEDGSGYTHYATLGELVFVSSEDADGVTIYIYENYSDVEPVEFANWHVPEDAV